MTKITVEVMPYDIRYGRRGSTDFCPIAFAVNRLLKPQYRVNVGRFDLVIYHQNVAQTIIELPERTTEFTKAFDNGKTVEPFSFQLDIPERFLR